LFDELSSSKLQEENAYSEVRQEVNSEGEEISEEMKTKTIFKEKFDKLSKTFDKSYPE
jgi:hemerythrin-like domain-containing protein